jgi:hypothetical protein
VRARYGVDLVFRSMSAAAAAGKPVHAKRKADVDASAATAAAASDTTVAVVAKKAKPSTTLPKSKSPLYNELTAALMKKQEEPAVTGLPIHDLIYHIWQYANGTHTRSLGSPLIPKNASVFHQTRREPIPTSNRRAALLYIIRTMCWWYPPHPGGRETRPD